MGLGFTKEYHKQLHPNYVKGSLTCLNAETLRKYLPTNNPLVLNIELTNVCNAKCTFCTNQFNTTKDFMSADLFTNIIKQVNQWDNLLTINWHKDGETLLHPESVGMIALARGMTDAWFHMNTNGILLDKKIRVMEYLDDVTVSIDAFGSERYRKRKGIDMYHHVVDNVLTAHNKYGKIRVKIMEGNDVSGGEVESFLEFWDREGVPTQVTGFHNWSGKVDVEITDEKKSERFPCPLIWYAQAVCANGDVQICNVSDDSGKVGNVSDGIPLHRLFLASNVRFGMSHMRGVYRPSVCEKCVVWASCPRLWGN
jgi:molybdenum cofactor biosynthesis enzyme MoaA